MTDRAQQLAEAIRLADEYAHYYAFVGDDTMPRKRAELHAAIAALSQGASEVRAVAPPAVGVVPWQPIETAPWDGLVLLRVPTTHGKWAQSLALPGRWFNGFWVTYNHDEAITRVTPTHWMPHPGATQPAPSRDSTTPSAQCVGDPGECTYNGACMYACEAPPEAQPPIHPTDDVMVQGWTYEAQPAEPAATVGHSGLIYNTAALPLPVGTKLYTAQPAEQRKPLTEAQLRAIFTENGFTIKEGQFDLKPYVYAAARAIERAHGIKEQP